MNQNTLIALQLAAQLLSQLQNINAVIQQAQAAGVDVSPEQLDGLATDYTTVHAQLDHDIAAAKAAGK